MEIDFSKVDELERTPARFPKWLIWLLVLSPTITILLFVISIEFIDSFIVMLLLVLMSCILPIVGTTLLSIGVGYPNRVVRSYLGHDNEYDLTTPRKYTALASNWWMARMAWSSRYLLDSFIYTDHNIRITTKKGQVLTAALDEVMFSCKLEYRHRGRILWFDVTQNDGKERVCFYYIKGMFMKEEWTDMLNILLRAKTEYDFSDAEFFKRFSRFVKIEANMQLLGNFH